MEVQEPDDLRKEKTLKVEKIKKNPIAFAVGGIVIALVAGVGMGSFAMKKLVLRNDKQSVIRSAEVDEENVLGEVKKEKGVSIEVDEETGDEIPEFKVGETWTVDGLWSVTINSVTATDKRYEEYNKNKNPEAVYIVDYTYENLGYEEETYSPAGSYINLSGDSSNNQIVDSDGEMGYGYTMYELTWPEVVPVRARMTAQVAIGVNHKGTFAILYEEHISDKEDVYNSKVYKVKFICEPTE